MYRLYEFLLLALLWVLPVTANTEKVIFTAPEAAVLLKSVVNGSDFSTVGELSAAQASEKLLLRTELPRAFPTKPTPRGIDSWVLLRNLKPGARYEVRVCWAATTPSDFWLSVHSPLGGWDNHAVGPGSHLYLKISAIATYFSSNATLMKDPQPVLVDVILDEFLLGVLPRSLLNFGIFALCLAVAAWFVGVWVVRWLDGIAKTETKAKAA